MVWVFCCCLDVVLEILVVLIVESAASVVAPEVVEFPVFLGDSAGSVVFPAVVG